MIDNSAASYLFGPPCEMSIAGCKTQLNVKRTVAFAAWTGVPRYYNSIGRHAWATARI